jgi:hypothetical protein
MDPRATGGPSSEQAASDAPERRRDERVDGAFGVTTISIDALHERPSRAPYYQSSDEDRVVELSRRGVRLVSPRPPEVGTRLWLQIRSDDDEPALELIGRACWTRVSFERGVQGARPLCTVGVEVMGGSAGSLDRYERLVARLERARSSLAAPPTLG